jgi:histidinol-phosphate aminotransferase
MRERSAIASLPAFEPGPQASADVRLAANESPLGPFPSARDALIRHAGNVHRYPSLDGEVIARLAALHAIPVETIAIGNGADAIIGYISAAFLEPGDEVLTGWPSFPTYVLDARKQGAEPVLAPLKSGAVDLEALAERIGPRTRLIWICTPNNPTGGTVERDKLAAFLDRVPEDVLVVIDEAYYEYAAGSAHLDAIREHVVQRPNVGALRTFSKLYGLAALRIGWFAGPPPVARALGKVRHYYDVGELSSIAALASLDDDAERERRRLTNIRERERLEAELRGLGVAFLPSRANFLALVVQDAAALADRLLAGGVLVRPLDALGSPELLRVTVGGTAEVDRLLELLADALIAR